MSMVAAGVALYGAYSANQAAGAQTDQANRSTALSAEQGAQTRADLAPYRQSGTLANARLMALLGLGGGGSGGSSAVAPSMSQYWRAGPSVRAAAPIDYTNARPTPNAPSYVDVAGPQVFDQAGYDSAMANYNSSQANPVTDPSYGSLLKPFTGADLTNEPGYQFTLSEGNKGIDRAAAAAGRYDSGQTLKELTRYGEDYAGTKYNDAFNRDQANKNMAYNFLAGQSGQGVNASTMTGNLGNAALGMGNTARGNAGDATAAGYIGQANALTGGLNTYLQNQNNQATLAYLRNRGSGTGWGTSSSGNPGSGLFTGVI